MSLRILGGKAKGFSLVMPERKITRPTSALLKRKIFDAHQNLSGFRFIDLFAGSGSIGLEAWSRQASPVVLIEKNEKVFSLLKKNAMKMAQTYQFDCHDLKLVGKSAQFWLLQNKESLTNHDIVYLDPPYEDHHHYRETLEILVQTPVQIWIESDRLKGIKQEELAEMVPYIAKTYQQGDHFICVVNGK